MPTGFTITPPPLTGSPNVPTQPIVITAVGGNFNPMANGQTISLIGGNSGDRFQIVSGAEFSGPSNVNNPEFLPLNNTASFAVVFVGAVAMADSVSFENNQGWTNPGSLTFQIQSSMLLALVNAIMAFLAFLQIDTPTLFPMPFNCLRRYGPIEDFTDIPSSAAPTNAPPTIYLFPHDDPEDRDGLNQAGFEGDFEVGVVILANIGQPINPQYLPLVDSMMSLRQSLREVLRPQNAISLAPNSGGSALLTEISTADSFLAQMLKQGIFCSIQVFKFHLITVAQ